MLDRRGLPVHRHGGADDVSTERGANRLVPETHAEDRDRPPQLTDHVHRHAGVLRLSGSVRDHNPLLRRRVYLFECNSLVSHHYPNSSMLAVETLLVVTRTIVSN